MPDSPERHQAVLPTTAQALLGRLAREQAEARAPAMVGGLVRDGALVWNAGRGRVWDVPPGRPGGTEPVGSPPDAGVQFRIGSITKTFTAVLVARLRDEGRLDLADPLDRHLGGTPLGDRTVAQLLSHTAGVQAETSGEWWERTPGADWSALSATLSPESAKHRAGRRFHYSNVGFGALGELVARKRGKPWWEVLRTEVLDPLGMRRTTYSPEAPHAAGFAVHPWADVVLTEPTHDSGAMAPAGQLWSTVEDLARWSAFVGGDTGDVLAADTLAEMREPNTVETGPDWTSGYGLGLQVIRHGGRVLVGHGGSMPGYLAGLYVDVEERLGAVVLSNTTAGVNPVSLGADLIGIVAEGEPLIRPEWNPVAGLPREVLEILGPWYWGPTAFVLRSCPDGMLELGPIGERGRASRLRRNADGTWTGLDGYYAGEILRVVRRADGSLSHLDLASFVFTREPYDVAAPIPGGVAESGWTPVG